MIVTCECSAPIYLPLQWRGVDIGSDTDGQHTILYRSTASFPISPYNDVSSCLVRAYIPLASWVYNLFLGTGPFNPETHLNALLINRNRSC